MPRWLSIPIGLAMMLGAIGFFAWLFWRSLDRSDDPAKLVFRWILTGLVVGAIGWIAIRTDDPFSQVAAIPFVCVLGLVLAVMWGPSIAAIVARPFTSLFDGGYEESDPQPFYSIAVAKRKQGHYREAMHEIQGQLTRFPNDATGQVLLAEIQAQNLNDLDGAAMTIQRLCNQPAQQPPTIAMALHELADWHLKYRQDPDEARAALQQIVDRFPDSDLGQRAAQRIAHLSSRERLVEQADRPALHLKHGEQYLGLVKDQSQFMPKAVDPEEESNRLVQHLESYPLDNEAREALAVIYAEHYKRLDLAAEQLEQLIAQPHQSSKHIAQWLNLLADLHLKYANDLSAAEAALKRIVEAFPGHAVADVAERRLGSLKYELKRNEKSQVIKLGSHESSAANNV